MCEYADVSRTCGMQMNWVHQFLREEQLVHMVQVVQLVHFPIDKLTGAENDRVMSLKYLSA
jgi:hypothetical protein